MTRAPGLRRLHWLRGRDGGRLVVVGQHPNSGPRCWFGRTPAKGAAREFEVFDDGTFKWRHGYWEAGSVVWTLAEVRNGAIVRAVGLVVALVGGLLFGWRVLG